MATPFEDSRRLTGPNLYFGTCGAALEARLPGGGPKQTLQRWRALVQAMRHHLGWPEGPVVARAHASGASLAFAAPEDQLYTATELNEWAWLRALAEVVETRCPRPFAPGHPAVWDEASALMTLKALAVEEARPELVGLIQEAQRCHLPTFLDDEVLSIGAGCGHVAWPLDALPTPEAVPWPRLHGIPTALVTGSNGKTTSTRLLSAMASAQGRTPGFTCTDGIFVGGDQVAAGDFSGPMGARSVLQDARVELAILETARGGILRRGLAVLEAEVALVTNVSPEHFGEYGIHSLADLADVKLVVARAVAAGGLLVLNADDNLLAAQAQASTLAGRLAWFSLDDEHPMLRQHRDKGGATAGVREGRLHLHWRGDSHDLGAVASMPLSAGGHAAYNISNLAGAALAAAGLGIPPAVIASVLATFGAARGDNPGRLETWRFGGIEVFLDYAHNPEGLTGLLTVAAAARGTGRLGLLLGQAGNREDSAIRELAATAARFQPDRVVLKDLEGFMRGRESGEVPALLRDELQARGMASERLQVVLPEEEAVLTLLGWAKAGDVLVLPVHGLQVRNAVGTRLDRLQAARWQAGDPIS